MIKKLKPADEVDAYCTKCKLDLAHRIISLDGDKPHKVECLTCRSHHLYRKPKSAAPEPKAARPKAASSGGGSSTRATSPRAVAAAQSENQREREWEKRVSGKAVTDFKPYRISSTFVEGDLVHHAKFLDGYIVRVIDKNKVEVMFKDGLRTLAHGIES